jgi:hypothetical protein
MHRHFADAIRAAIALQVAVLEFEGSEVSDTEAAKGVILSLKASEKAVKAMLKAAP